MIFQVVTTGKVTRLDRIHAWSELKRAAKEKKTRPFYRAVNKDGLMYAGIHWSFISFSSNKFLLNSCNYNFFTKFPQLTSKTMVCL